ncbi:hypothetical protein HU200_024547 [Digitaria exilis]|uniref:Uncharacterized protein n=1 Tax=Digitaria exilis TaxID=1010633 RepID=A0A835ETM9_9POAL|nr:hypothetical protein HU200_024547 [Digitaria exilis]
MVTVFLVSGGVAEAAPHRILVDTDMDTDDLFALLYLLKQNRSEFDLKVRYSSLAPSILFVVLHLDGVFS